MDEPRLRRQTRRFANNTQPSTRKKGTTGLLKVDFAKLEMSSLKRYRAAFQLDVPANASKVDLIHAVSKHFACSASPKLHEAEIISEFLYATRRQDDTWSHLEY